MRIGFVVAMEEEYAPFIGRLGKEIGSEGICGAKFCTYESDGNVVVLGQSGIGEIAAAATTALLIGRFGCDYIVNFGLVGSLNGATTGTLACVKDVVHYDCDVTAFGYAPGQPAGMDVAYFETDLHARASVLAKLPALRLASGDKFISDTTLKNKLVAEFSADICDMEGAAIAITCTRAATPFSLIKYVSDAADEAAAETFSLNKTKAFGTAVELVLSLLRA